jgi:protein-S-isoprenylcysteine O-methyltransferase Ste14
MKGKILVTIQFTCIALMLIFTNWLALPWWTFILLGLSGMLALWAMKVMKPGNFNIVPHPVEKGIMVSRGPYRLIRHPMYTSILIFAFALLAGQFGYIKLTVSLVLVAGLIVKMIYEEGLLRDHFPDYKEYMGKTKRIIPLVW